MEEKMKVLLVNGSPNKNGCTHTALHYIAEVMKTESIETEEFWIGNKPISGCIGCRGCIQNGKCVFNSDAVNVFGEYAATADGIIFGSPVHYASAAGNMGSFMDRVFFSDFCGKKENFYLKPAAAVVSARRAGTTATLDQMNKYFLHAQMPIVSSRYWNGIHGNTPEEIMQDQEGLQILRVLARNMAWFLKLKEAGEKQNIPFPIKEENRIATNFIR